MARGPFPWRRTLRDDPVFWFGRRRSGGDAARLCGWKSTKANRHGGEEPQGQPSGPHLMPIVRIGVQPGGVQHRATMGTTEWGPGQGHVFPWRCGASSFATTVAVVMCGGGGGPPPLRVLLSHDPLFVLFFPRLLHVFVRRRRTGMVAAPVCCLRLRILLARGSREAFVVVVVPLSTTLLWGRGKGGRALCLHAFHRALGSIPPRDGGGRGGRDSRVGRPLWGRRERRGLATGRGATWISGRDGRLRLCVLRVPPSSVQTRAEGGEEGGAGTILRLLLLLLLRGRRKKEKKRGTPSFRVAMAMRSVPSGRIDHGGRSGPGPVAGLVIPPVPLGDPPRGDQPHTHHRLCGWDHHLHGGTMAT